MIWLWLIVALFTLLVIALLLWPLLRADGADGVDRLAYDLTVYRDQLDEIERDRARGLLSEDQAQAARVEVERRILSAAGKDDAATAAAHSRDGIGGDDGSVASASGRGGVSGMLARARLQGEWGTATLAAVLGLVPVGAVSLYLMIGSPALPGLPHAERISNMTEARMARLPAELRDSIQAMRAVLEATPDDAAAWLELGGLYRQADLHGPAYQALRTAQDLGVEHDRLPTVLSEMGESLLLSQQGRVSNRVRQHFLEALRLDPDEPRARFQMGTIALQDGEPERALAIWRHLAADSPPDAPWMPMLRQGMMMVAQQSGIPPASVKPAHPLELAAGEAVERLEMPAGTGEAAIPRDDGPAGAAPGARMRAEADANRAPGQGFSEDERAMIEGMVSGLAARLEENPDDPDGWLRLARAYGVMGRWDEARDAAEQALEQAPKDPAVLDRAAETFLAAARAEGASGPPDRVFPLFRVLLEQDPENAKALYFVGLEAARSGDNERARTLWGRLLEGIPEGEPARAAIQQRIDALSAVAGDGDDGGGDAGSDATGAAPSDG